MRTKDNELVNRIKLYIEEQIDRRGRMPTIRDIAEALDVGKVQCKDTWSIWWSKEF